MQVTAYRAGHVLGACMFEVEIAGMRLVYTGDYSRVPDRHLSAADTPNDPPHIGGVYQACYMCISNFLQQPFQQCCPVAFNNQNVEIGPQAA